MGAVLHRSHRPAPGHLHHSPHQNRTAPTRHQLLPAPLFLPAQQQRGERYDEYVGVGNGTYDTCRMLPGPAGR